MQKIIMIIFITMLGIGYIRAQIVMLPTEEDLKQRPIPAGKTISRSQLMGKNWRCISPYYGDVEEVWQFTEDTILEHIYNYKDKQWKLRKYNYYLDTDTAYTYDDRDFDDSKVGKVEKGICIVQKRFNENTYPHYYRVIKIDVEAGILELFRKGRWDEIGGGDCYIKYETFPTD